MIYKILKPIIKLSLRVYFRRIDVIGQENIPENGPVIFVANHPSALMDPLTVASTLSREVHFLAGSEWFGQGFKARFFKNQLNMIPVHRPWLAKGEKVSNKDMFEECYKSMAKGKCIILFPEASSETVSKIRELKTGAVRIKEGFEKYINNGEAVPIVPVGLSYSNAHAFQSRAVVKINEAVTFTNEERAEDPKELYRMQTEQMRDALKKSIIHIDNHENEGLVNKISRLYMDMHQTNNGVSFRNGQNKFEFNQNVAKAVSHFEKNDEENYQTMSNRIDDYFMELMNAEISDDMIGQTKRSRISWTTWTFLILGLTLAIPCFVLFAIPFMIIRSLFFKRFRPKLSDSKEAGKLDTTFTGTLIFGIGAIVFMLWTLIVAGAIGLTFGVWPALFALVSIYPLMRFSMYYSKIFLRFKRFYKAKKIIELNEKEVSTLEQKRLSILESLREYQLEYDSVK